jgi:hypothetical protein
VLLLLLLLQNWLATLLLDTLTLVSPTFAINSLQAVLSPLFEAL